MSIETEIQTEVDALKARFTDTKPLYREVCGLLFFRYGITPTTSKLYQVVRKGSMSAPADALAKFWEELRSKARVEIDHPDLPAELKATAAEAIASIWRQATAAARNELADHRIEIEADLERAQSAAQRANAAAAAAAQESDNLQRRLVEAEESHRALNTELEVERRAHAASVARLQEVQRSADELRAQQQRMQESFSADLAKAHEGTEAANSRADASERRSLIEIDQERQARGRAEKALEVLRTQSTQTEDRLKADAHAAAQTQARLAAKVHSLERTNTQLSTAVETSEATARELRGGLANAESELTRIKAEADTLRSVLERFSAHPPAIGTTKLPRPRKG